jgi:hypothetical protein
MAPGVNIAIIVQSRSCDCPAAARTVPCIHCLLRVFDTVEVSETSVQNGACICTFHGVNPLPCSVGLARKASMPKTLRALLC